jgi:hypothetical protein
MDNSKHLEMIQKIIDRFAQNCFLIKGWVITVALAGYGFFLSNKTKPIFLLLIITAVVIFWVLDSYYLKQERLFRKLYAKNAADLNSKKYSYSMDVSEYKDEIHCVICTMFSFPTVLFYLAILVMSGFVYLY